MARKSERVTFVARFRINPNPVEAPADGYTLHDGGKGEVGIGSLANGTSPDALCSIQEDYCISVRKARTLLKSIMKWNFNRRGLLSKALIMEMKLTSI